MPNSQNIGCPISLIAYGRSGTSVLFRALAAHPEVDATGETANLIFTTWRALEQISGITRYGKIEDRKYARDASQLVQNAFLRIFPSRRQHWVQKPIGTPRIFRDFPNVDSDDVIKWYWKVFWKSFPQSRNFSIIRNPKDVFVSAKKYWGSPDEAIWRSQNLMYRIIAHRKDNFRLIVRHADMILNPADTLNRILEAVELPFHPDMLKEFERLHVPAKEQHFGSREELVRRRNGGFSHNECRASLVMTEPAKRATAQYHRILEKFGLPPDEMND